MKVNWRRIKGFEDYEISSLGEVRSMKKSEPRVLKPFGSQRAHVSLYRNGNPQVMKISNLLRENFG